MYWIFDESCVDPFKDGYIGVTKQLKIRLKSHLRFKRAPPSSLVRIMFSGTREECFIFEKYLRPRKGIGWNNAVGGSHGWRVGFSHSDETRSKMKDAWTSQRREKASKLRKEINQRLIGQKRPKQSESMRGEKNPMFGTKRPEYVKEALRNAHKGKPSHNRQEIYCVGCRQRTSLSVLKKYHSKCQ